MNIGYRVGARVPAHAFAGFTALTVKDAATFERGVRSVREQGFAATVGRLDDACAGISVPLIDRKGQCKRALGMTVRSATCGMPDLQSKVLPHMREAAQLLRPLL